MVNLGNFTAISHPFFRTGINLSQLNAREKAYLIIRDKIIYMDLKPGEPLSDKLLADQLQMSRTPVREALILLSAYNMVVMKPQIGTFVTPIDPDWVAMEQFSRLTMEKEIIRMACSHPNDELNRQYQQNTLLYKETDLQNSAEKIRVLHELDNRFHGLAFAAEGKLSNFYHMHSYMQHIERLRVLTLMLESDKNINSDHTRIANAVAEQDTTAAIRALESHLNVYKDSLNIAKLKHPEFFVLG